MRVAWLLAVGFSVLAVWLYQSNDADSLAMLFPAMNWASALVLACVWRTRKRPAV